MSEGRLVSLRVHQRDAALDAREAFAAAVSAAPPGPDLITIATCHRVECYAAAPRDRDPRRWIRERLGATPVDASCEVDAAAAGHLFRVSCGLDSAIRGEGQVLAQVRRTYEAARAPGPLDSLLADLFQTALHLARELRATTALGDVRRSVGSLAVDVAVGLLADPTRANALVVGAGEVGKLASRALATRVGSLVVANRDVERAREVGRLSGARLVGLDSLDKELERADLLISAADTRGALLTADRLSRRLRRGPLVLIDIAVPRSVGEAERALPGLVYRSVDDLGAERVSLSEEVVRDAEARCAAEATAFARRREARGAATTIEALHDHGDRLRRRQLDRALAKLGHLGDRDRAVVESLAAALTKALLHAPTTRLKDAPERAEAARELFGLEPRR